MESYNQDKPWLYILLLIIIILQIFIIWEMLSFDIRMSQFWNTQVNNTKSIKELDSRTNLLK